MSPTPGRWRYNLFPDSGWEVYTEDESVGHDGLLCTTIADCNKNPDDALLIAAAPDLLQACKAMLFALDRKDKPICACAAMKPGYTCPYCRARAAIAKAEGWNA